MSDIRVEDIKTAIRRMDLLMRPYIVFMHPDNYEDIKAMFPNFEDEYQVEVIDWIEKGRCFLMKREELEIWKEEIDFE